MGAYEDNPGENNIGDEGASQLATLKNLKELYIGILFY